MGKRRVLNLSFSPVSGMAFDLHRAINEDSESGWESDIAQGRYGYNDGRSFGSGVTFDQKDVVDQMVRRADAFILHNNGPMGSPDTEKGEVLIPSDDRPVVWILYSPYWWWQPWSWGHLPRFKLCTFANRLAVMWHRAMPDPINLLPHLLAWPSWASQSSVAKKIASFRDDSDEASPLVCFSPSDLAFNDDYHTKGAPLVSYVCSRLEEEGVIRYNQVTNTRYEDCLKYKMAANIGIDEVVTGGYHKSLFEFLAAGCATITGASREVWQVLEECFQRAGQLFVPPPVIQATAPTLERALRSLAASGGNSVGDWGMRGREWIEEYFNPFRVLRAFYYPLLEA